MSSLMFRQRRNAPIRRTVSIATAVIACALNLSAHAATPTETCGAGGEDIRKLRGLKSAKLAGAVTAQGKSAVQASTSTASELQVFTVLLELAEGGASFSDSTLLELPGLIYGAPSNTEPNGPALSVARRFDIESYGQLTLTGIHGNAGTMNDIIGPFTIDHLDCDTIGTTIQEVITAHEESVDWSPLENGAQLLVLFAARTGLNCPYDGIATWHTMSSDDFSQPEVTIPLAASLKLSQRNIAHELGHTLGAGHAGTMECEGEAWNLVPYSLNSSQYSGDAQCGSRAYGDFRGMMGTGGLTNIVHSGAIIKEELGFLSVDDNAPHRVELVTETGDYQIIPLSEENLGGVKAIKFPSGMNQFAYVEVRSPYNEDGTTTADHAVTQDFFLTHASMFTGAHMSHSLYLGWAPTASLLLDGQPTAADPPLSDTFTYQFALPYTQSYTDPLSGTEVTLGFPPTFGPVAVHVEMGRADFTGPTITNLQITPHPTDPCTGIVSAYIHDPAGLSAIKMNMNNVVFAGNLELDIPLPGDDGLIEFEFQRHMTGPISAVKITAWDDASSGGIGIAVNSHSTSATIDFPFDNNCDQGSPEATLFSPSANQVVDGPLRVHFQITENETAILHWGYSIFDTTSFSAIVSALDYLDAPTQQLEVDHDHVLPAGNYAFRIYAGDIHGNNLASPLIPFTVPPRTTFLRGDVNDDGTIDLADAIALFDYLYSGGNLACLSAADANDDGVVNVADPIVILQYIKGQAALPAPFSEPGPDPTGDALTCSWVAS